VDTVNLVIGLIGLVGITGLWRFYDTARRHVYSRIGSTRRVEKEVRDIVRRRTYPYHQQEAGTYESVPVKFFVDLLSASGDRKDRDVLDRWLTRWVWHKRLRPTHVAVPKRGNVVLASTVARRLGLPLVVVYQESTLHERPYEGYLERGDRVLLVDDISSDADFLMRVVERLRLENVHIVGTVVLVDRAEGRCATALAEAEIRFYPVITLGDEDLRQLTIRPT
jgi:orotate phosphoribosyltransferase